MRGGTNELLPDTTDYPTNYDKYAQTQRRQYQLFWKLPHKREVHIITLSMWKPQHIII